MSQAQTGTLVYTMFMPSIFSSKDRVLEVQQWIPQKIEHVFPFFCDEKNLERLTPPNLNFQVIGKDTPSLRAGTLIDYKLKLYGIPFSWKTLIESWDPGKSFVDTQLKGPYVKWHHTHTFVERDGGTSMTDRVVYRLPMGILGDLVAGWFVDKEVRSIFDFRKKVVKEIFCK